MDTREGSFPSIEAANDFTNRVLQMNKDIVDMVASGKMDEKFLEERFGYRTGREARWTSLKSDATPYLRDTFSVGVLVRHDPKAVRGYYIVTAYPRND